MVKGRLEAIPEQLALIFAKVRGVIKKPVAKGTYKCTRY